MTNEILKLKTILYSSSNIVFFGGAGVSTESGIPDFTGEGGLYTDDALSIPPKKILTTLFLINHTDIFYKYYKSKMLYPNAKPNAVHLKIAALEAEGKLKAVITQNIDGLHAKAGSKNVIELHGSIYRNYCMSCGKAYDLNYILESDSIPLCETKSCGGIIRPDVVLYTENLRNENIIESIKAISNADLLIIGGTSLSVYPAAGLIDYFKGNNLVIINKTPTHCDNKASIIISDNIGDVMRRL